PIPFVVAMRYVMHLNIRYLPISLAASVLGQFIGGKIRDFRTITRTTTMTREITEDDR
ncbi:hypothetical protein MBAV_005368, partial [Candidatus Magnetobacterium bavaricum]